MIHEWSSEDISRHIAEHLPIKLKEKREFGEVFTPEPLMEQMLDAFPADVWTDPTRTWLDPGCGVGNFMLCVHRRLMQRLEPWCPDRQQRSSHIVQHMLYMVELGEANVACCRRIFGSGNVVHADFLSLATISNQTKFDCIVGNPPFQEPGKKGGKAKLAERFVAKCLHQLLDKERGVMSMIAPDNMFGGWSSAIYADLIASPHFRVSRLNVDNKHIQTYFKGIQQPMCTFLLVPHSKDLKQETTTILHGQHPGQSFETILSRRPINPVRMWTPETEKMVETMMQATKNGTVYHRGKPLSFYHLTDAHLEKIYPLIYTKDKRLYTDCERWAVGYGKKKAVVFAISTRFEFLMDWDGSFGVGPNTFYIPFDTEKEGQHIAAFLNSDKYKQLATCCKTSRQFLKIGFMEHLRLPK
jgi:hypothetical protein